jgi:hypothetical protein
MFENVWFDFIFNRRRLFNMINNLPTIFEVVTGVANKQNKEKGPNSTSKSNKTSSKMVSLDTYHDEDISGAHGRLVHMVHILNNYHSF